EAGLMRQMKQHVSVNVEDMPLSKAVRELARNHGVNLVIDPAVNAKAEAKVSLQLDDAGLETAVRLLSELASLKAVRMGNVLFVTSEEKAKKIRKEETQLDPFNPNMPPIPRIGIGGAFGGIAMPLPARVAPPAVAPAPGGLRPQAPIGPP